ncbi:MAG: phosphoglycerate dehydrogenase [Eubacteriales bacterium]|nr:phosphoglycerate dehydrogenase [Eubacteriales bacterium]
MKKVLVLATDYDVLCKDGLKMLRDFGCEVGFNAYGRPYTYEELTQVMGDVDGVIANMEVWNKASMDASPKLKVIARFGTGYDSVDLEEAKKHGIVVTNCPGLNAPAVAEHAVALLFAAVRDVPRLDRTTKEGGWERTMFHELSGRTVGILGLGHVGQNFARMLKGFGCNIIAYNRTPRPELEKALGIKQCELDEVLKESDYLSIHLGSNAGTYHIINAERLAMMKKEAIVVNTARGVLVDERAMLEALQSGQIAAYATDVFEREPVDKENLLLTQPNYICTPHSSGQTFENYRNTGIATAQAVIDVLSGREPANRRA